MSPEEFLEAVERSHLVDSAQLKELNDTAPNDVRTSAEEYARWLIQEGVLTEFQAKSCSRESGRG